jgi:hypothetical protein
MYASLSKIKENIRMAGPSKTKKINWHTESNNTQLGNSQQNYYLQLNKDK